MYTVDSFIYLINLLLTARLRHVLRVRHNAALVAVKVASICPLQFSVDDVIHAQDVVLDIRIRIGRRALGQSRRAVGHCLYC